MGDTIKKESLNIDKNKTEVIVINARRKMDIVLEDSVIK